VCVCVCLDRNPVLWLNMYIWYSDMLCVYGWYFQ